MRLEDLVPNAAVRGIIPDGLATVVSVQWFDSEALELTYKKTASGRVENELLYRRDEPRIEVIEPGGPWSFDGEGDLFRLVSEAHRIRPAHLFGSVLAVVEFQDDDSHQGHYVRQPFQREPDFGVTSVNYDFRELLAQAEEPR